MVWVKAAIGAMAWASAALAQDPQSIAPMDTQQQWKNFLSETLSPLAIGGGLFNGAEAHVTNTDPKYGTDHPALGAQVGASTVDIATPNFFAEFLLASVFHEDPRYFRRGEGFCMRSRVWYAISRSVVTRTDEGRSEFNWSNVLGTAISASLSNAYYPASARTPGDTFQRIGVGILGTGLVRLGPEFWPDFRRKVFGKR